MKCNFYGLIEISLNKVKNEEKERRRDIGTNYFRTNI